MFSVLMTLLIALFKLKLLQTGTPIFCFALSVVGGLELRMVTSAPIKALCLGVTGLSNILPHIMDANDNSKQIPHCFSCKRTS